MNAFTLATRMASLIWNSNRFVFDQLSFVSHFVHEKSVRLSGWKINSLWGMIGTQLIMFDRSFIQSDIRILSNTKDEWAAYFVLCTVW